MNDEISILLIETDTFQQEIFSIILEEGGFKVYCVNTVAEAINFMRNETNIDLIVSDLMLPDASGIDLMIMLSELKMIKPTILISSFRTSEIQLFSGKNIEELVDDLKQYGFKGLIEKPSNSEYLIKEISKIICVHPVIDEESDISTF